MVFIWGSPTPIVTGLTHSPSYDTRNLPFVFPITVSPPFPLFHLNPTLARSRTLHFGEEGEGHKRPKRLWEEEGRSLVNQLHLSDFQISLINKLELFRLT